MFTEQDLRHLWPRAKPNVITGVMEAADRVLDANGLTTPLLVAHLMAQISHECGAGTIVREDMSYTAPRIIEIFGVGHHSAAVTAAEAQRLAHNPEGLAERVYGLGNPKKAKELGNTQPGDGYRFRGNGMLQLTGRASHARIGKMVGFDLENHPELLENPATSFEVAVKEFVALGCLAPAAADNINLVTRKVNGGTNGLAERIVWLRRWKGVLDGVDEPAQKPRGAEPPPPKQLRDSNIARGGGAVGAVGLLSAGNELLKTVSETTSTVKDASDNVVSVVTTAKPVLGLPPELLSYFGLFGAVLVVIGAGFIIYHRFRKLQDEGV